LTELETVITATTSDLETTITQIGEQARAAARQLMAAPREVKDRALNLMAEALEAGRPALEEANQRDLDAGKEAGLTAALLDRLELTDKRIDGMIAGLREIAELDDPVGQTLETIERPNGLRIDKVRSPIGVIAIIYESRPNVTADAAALCLKSGNAVILRGGREAKHSNAVIADAMASALEKAGLPSAAIQLIRQVDRDAVRILVQLRGLVDLVIPRGGEGLIESVTRLAHVPVIKHYKGVCHTYVDKAANPAMAVSICENAKCQRPGVCNAMETLIVHEAIAPSFLPTIAKQLIARGVELRGDDRARALVAEMKAASEADWDEEYLDLILSVRVVPSLDEAIAHIARYGSGHSDAIVSDDEAACARFTAEVDSAATYVNASTRFTDGAEFGMGAEIGISTDKLHARGPMGLPELTSYRFIVHGQGQIRS
jgi:glutamate-5-semialdehyde dehydrogenase